MKTTMPKKKAAPKSRALRLIEELVAAEIKLDTLREASLKAFDDVLKIKAKMLLEVAFGDELLTNIGKTTAKKLGINSAEYGREQDGEEAQG